MQLGLDVVQTVLGLGLVAVALGDVEQVSHPLAQCLKDDASHHMVAVVGRQIPSKLVEVRMQATQLDVRGLRLANGLVYVSVDLRYGDREVGIVHFQFFNVPEGQVDRTVRFQVIGVGAGVEES